MKAGGGNNMKDSDEGKRHNERHSRSREVENVLVLQGGGSLGAFACGVFRALATRGIKMDIVAGTSIGAVNAAIIAGSKSGRPDKDLEDFWIELAESSYGIIPDMWYIGFDEKGGLAVKELPAAGINAALFGVSRMFWPRWLRGPEPSFEGIPAAEGPLPYDWTYLYDHTPLGKTLEKYVDFSKLDGTASAARESAETRLIVTTVDVLTAEPIVFDSATMAIRTKHLLASTGYPIYGFPWVEIEPGVHAWDGSLLDNTPVRQVIQASPRNDKHIYIVENYARRVDRLPSNMVEVADRAKDIIFGNKTKAGIRLARFITRQIRLIEELYDVFEATDHSKMDNEKIRRITGEYRKIVSNYGAEILSVNHIVRESEGSAAHMLKNANFTVKEVKRMIAQGERKALECLDAK
jgi:NTE family protein